MFHRTAAALAALIVPVIVLGAPAAGQSLSDALTLAYSSNPTLQAERARVRALDENFVQARSGLLPSLDADASVSATDAESRRDAASFGVPGATGTTVTSDTSATASVGVSARQSLYQGGRVRASMDGALAAIEAGRAGLQSVEQRIFVDVITAYVDVRRDEEVIAIRQNNVAVLERQLQAAQDRFDVGVNTRTDVAQARQRLAAARAALIAADGQLATSRATFRQVVGQEPAALEPTPELTGLPDTVIDALESAVENNPDLIAARFAEAGARAGVREAKAAFRPSAGLSASASRSDGLLTGGSDQDAATLGASVTIPLFTGGLNSSRLRQARESENQARIQIAEAERAVRQAVTASWTGLASARGQIEAVSEQVAAAEIAFESVEEEVRVGERVTLDVLDAEQELLEARLALVNAERDATVAAARVLQSVGALTAQTLGVDADLYDPAVNFSSIRGSYIPNWLGGRD